jgi:hypothetical protein
VASLLCKIYQTRFELFFVIIINFIDNNIQCIFVFRTFFILNEKHRKQFLKEKVALEEKIGEGDASSENTQRLLECNGMITRHKREIKKFEDWLSEKTTLPLKFEKVSYVNSVKLKAGVMASVHLSFFLLVSKE